MSAEGATDGVERTMVAWCPDWPVQAAAAEAGLDDGTPIAVVETGVVRACSAAARMEGVRRGLRVREAQSRCASLVVLPANEALDARRFEPALAALTAGVPTLQVVRPGVVVIRASGPARYYGSEAAAATAVLGRFARVGVRQVRVGVADGPFAAEQAARSAGPHALADDDHVRIVPPGDSALFLAPLPVAVLGLPDLAALLVKLGVRTLGAFAALPEAEVRDRFGPGGAAAHRVARGLDPRRMVPRIAPADRARHVDFEPPLEREDQIAFALRRTAEAFVAALVREGLVCTGLTVSIHGERGESSARTWLHPRSFSPLDVIDRVRWQLQATARSGDLASPVARVLLEPANLDAAANHEPGLWGGGPDERIHHALSRVQSMLGHESVLSPSVGGGRLAADRQVLVPWGERAVGAREADRPWPGRLPGFAPTRVFAEPAPVALRDPAGEPVTVDPRGALSAPPAVLEPPGGAPVAVLQWAGPWPVDERWWDPAVARSVQRMQLVCDDGTAWLVHLAGGSWRAEAHYD